MQTAAWVAHELIESSAIEIQINYQISENITSTDPGSKALDWHFKECPMSHLEYSRSGADFHQMRMDDPEYCTSKYFPEKGGAEYGCSEPADITFVDKVSKENEVEKQLIWQAFPEKGTDVFERAFRIARSSLENLKDCSTQNPTKRNSYTSLISEPKQHSSVCLLQFSHGQFVDSVAQLMKEDEENGKPEVATISNLHKICEKNDREQVVNFMKNVKYGFPSMCSISGYSVADISSTAEVHPELINYSEHVKGLLRDAK